MPSTLFDDADRTCDRGDYKQMDAALDAALKRRDPKRANGNRKTNSGQRRNLNYAERIPLLDLLKIAVRRLATDEARVKSRERQARYNQRKRRAQTVSAG